MIRSTSGLTLQLSLIAFICSAVLWVACSSPSDLVSADAGLDAPLYEAAAPLQEAGITPCELGDGGVAPTGKHVVTSPSVKILGVTTDGYAIYQDRAAGTVYAISLAGGEPEQIGPSWDASSTVVSILQGVVVYWTGVDFARAPLVGQLIVWTAAGHSRILSSLSIAGDLVVSADGKLVAYSDATVATFPAPDAGADPGTALTDFVVSAPDGTGKITLASKVQWSDGCQPNMAFPGTRVVIASCSTVNPPAPAATLRAYTGPTFASAVVLNAAPAYTGFGSDATRVSYYYAGSTLVVQTFGSSPIPLMADVYTSQLSHDGTFIVIVNNNGSIYRSPTNSPAVAFIAAGFTNYRELSPDDKWILANKDYDPILGLTDLQLVSAAPNSTPTPLVVKPTAAFFKDSFTKDNSRVMFGANNKKAPVGFFGDFDAVPLSAPTTPPLTLSGTSWDGYATKGSTVIYDDGYDIAFASLPLADIQVVDLANPAKRTKLVSKADADFYVNVDRTKAIYTWTYCADPRAGLYVVDLP